MRYKIAKEESEKQGKEIDEVLNKISQSGEVDSNLQKFTNLLHGQLAKDAKGNNWENIDFLEKMEKFPDSKEELKKEIERLIMEKSRLGKELANAQYNYAILQQINEDLKKKQEIEKKLYMKQINSLRKIAELVDRRNIPGDYDLNVLYNKEIKSKEKEEEKNINETNINNIDNLNKEIINRSVYTSITGFSKDSNEDDISIDENYLDLYITSANFDNDGIQNKLGIETDNLMSFISVDFYLHETQTSNLMTGQRPNYNFQLSFKVIDDENFISYLQDEYIIIELYYLKNNTQTIFANGKIKLSQLIQIESDLKTRVIHGYVEMFYIDDASIKLCDIKYKMRMRKSILEKIKWINEKNMLYNELDPVNEANMKIMSELNLHRPTMNMSLYQRDDINNKVYNIIFLI
jgi:protein fantom